MIRTFKIHAPSYLQICNTVLLTIVTMLWWVYVPACPTCFIVGLLMFAEWVGVSQLVLGFSLFFFFCFVFFFFPEEVIPYVVVDLVCLWEGVRLGSYFAILNQNSPIILENQFPGSQTQLISFPKMDSPDHVPVFTASPFLTLPTVSHDLTPHLQCKNCQGIKTKKSRQIGRASCRERVCLYV